MGSSLVCVIYNYFLKLYLMIISINFSCISMNNDESGSEWTKIQEMYENVQTNLVLALLFMCTKVECRKEL